MVEQQTEEYGYKDENDRWVTGFSSRTAAIEAGLKTGKTQVATAMFKVECPSYFARFQASAILSRLVQGLENGEELGKVIHGGSAIEFLTKIEKSDTNFLESDSPNFSLKLDLMNRLEKAVAEWICDNQLDFEKPKFNVHMSEELHVSGSDLNIQLL